MKKFNFKFKWVLVLGTILLLCNTQVWGAVYKTYSVSDLTYTSATLTYEKTGLSSNDQKLNKGERKVEVPCSSAAGTLYLSGTGNQSARHASIWGSNGTSYDATREISMTSGYGSGIAFTSADIKTENGKYYIIFGAGNSGGDDYKINAFKYVLSSSCSATCSTNATVTAGSNSSVTATSATVTCSGGISSLGSAGCSISSYGFVLGTSANPTISNTKYQVGTTYTTTGKSFSKNLTGLTAGTTYYVRPYATNGNGTAYGTQTSFTTLTQTYTVQFAASPNTYGTVSTSSVTVNEGTTVSSQTNNVLTVGSNTITATVTNDANYICRFANWVWSGHSWPSTVTSDMTISAVFTRKNIAPEITCSNNTVTISNNGVGTIYYTTNGTNPTSSSTTYSAPFTIEETTTVKAIVISNPTLVQNSDITTEECTYVAPSGNTLQYNANGGTGTMSNTTGTGSVTLRTNTFTKAGCSFAGWATSQDNANAGTVTYDDGDSYTLSADATLYAVWKVNTPAVDASTNVDVYGTTTLFITIPTDAEVRYTTNGDTPTPSSDLYDEDDGIEVTSGITVKAIAVRSNHITSDVLSVPFYNLSLGCENGTCSPASPYITKNHAYSITTDGTSGYAFRGWTIESGTGSFGSASTASTTFTMTSNGATIKAWWRLQCTITFNDASPSATGGEVGRTVYEGENTNLTTDVSIPSLDGATFAGYFTEEDGAGVQLVSETGEWITDVTGYIDADGKWAYDQSSVTLYAYWVVGTKTITGAVSPDGYGSISPAFISVTEGSTVSISGNVLTCDGKTLTASPASATSAWTYAFSSWSGVADDDEIADDVTATAVFTRTGKSYTITLDKEGGSGGSSNVSATYGSVMPSPGDAPTKDDYTFGGYYSAVGGGGTQYYTNACASAKNSDFTSASTLYAKWTQSISLDSEDGSSGSSSVTATYNSATLGSITNPTKTGYTFAGWYDGDDGTGNLVINTSGVLQANVSGYTGVGGVWTSSTAQTLYAKWNVNSYGVTYAGNGNTGGTVPTDGTSYDYGSDVTVASGVPTKSGSTFVGWLNNTNNTIYRAGQSFTITAATTLTAQWSTPTVTTYYYSQAKIVNGALEVGLNSASIQFFTNINNVVANSTAISLSSTPATGGIYYYSNNLSDSELSKSSNWSSSSSDGRYLRGLKFASGMTYTLALGTKVATSIKFYGWCGSASKTMTVGGQSFTSSSTKNTFETHNFTKSGNFTGNVSITQDGDFYGILVITTSTPSGYNVTFNASGKSATGMPSNYSGVPSGKKIAEPAEIPTVTNFIFDGWVTTSGGSTAFDFANTTITTDKTIYAKWTAKETPTSYTASADENTLCGAVTTTTIRLSGSQTGLQYVLYKNGNAVGDTLTGDGNALAWSGRDAGSYWVYALENETYKRALVSTAGTAVVNHYADLSITAGPTCTTASPKAHYAFSLSITATGADGYQWYSCNSDGTSMEEIAGKTTATPSITETTAGNHYYRCVVSGPCGDPITSSVVTVNCAQTYQLTYDANGGTGAPSATYILPGATTLSNTVPTYSGHRFLGWNTENDGTGDHYEKGSGFDMPDANTILYAEWIETATLTWTLATGSGESSVSTSDKNSTNGTRIAKSNMSNLTNSGLTITNAGKSGYTTKIEAPSSKDADKYMYVTFVVATNYEFVPSAVTATFQPVDAAASADMILSDTHGHSISITGASCSKGGANEKTITNGSGVAFSGTVTLKLYCYGSSVNTYRLGPTISITGDVNYICPERPTIVKPASAKALNVYADESKTLSVEVETYNSGALTYQWKKDGANIAGANSATYTVVGSTLTVGTTYAYTCDVTEEGACATVTSPAFNVKTASPNCGYNEIANAVLTAKNSATTSNATALYQNLSNSSAPYKLDKTLPSYFGLQLSSGNFQVGDSIIFKVKINDMNISGYDDYPVAFYHSTDTSSYTPASALYIAGGQTKNTDNIYIRFVVSQAMIDAGLTNKILIIRSGRVTQNHSMYEARIKRYTCPDVVMFDANTNSNWGTTSNWVGATGRGAGLPTSDVRALITKPVTVNVTNAVAGEVVIDQHSSNTGKLIIPSTGVLNVEGPITKTTNGTSLSATDVADVIIDCSKTSQGALIFEQPSSGLQTKGTVNFYTRSYRDGTSNKLQWQYVGYPFASGTDEDYDGYYINKYSESQGKWIVMRDQDDRSIRAWEGLAISGDDEGGAQLQGTFAPTTNTNVSLTHGNADGENLIGNSWTAPIQLADMDASDFGSGATATVYIFNTGRFKNDGSEGSSTESGTTDHTVGQWMTIPISSAKNGVWEGMKVIPAFQAFEVITSSATTLSLDYSKVVRSATNTMNAELHAPARRGIKAAEVDGYRIRVADSLTQTDMYLFEDITFTTDFDNGWEGYYMPCDGRSAQLYAQTALGKMAVAALPDLEGTLLGFKPGKSSEYTFSFGTNAGVYYLNDIKTQTSTLMQEGYEYTFTWEDGDDTNRFMISATPFAKTTPTDVEDGSLQKVDGVQKVIYKDHMYIIRGGRMFDATGAMVK